MFLQPDKEDVERFLTQEGNDVKILKYKDPEERLHTKAEADLDTALEAYDDSVDSWDAVYTESSEEGSTDYSLKLGGSRSFEASVAQYFRNESKPTSVEHHSLEITGQLSEDAHSLNEMLEEN